MTDLGVAAPAARWPGLGLLFVEIGLRPRRADQDRTSQCSAVFTNGRPAPSLGFGTDATADMSHAAGGTYASFTCTTKSPWALARCRAWSVSRARGLVTLSLGERPCTAVDALVAVWRGRRSVLAMGGAFDFDWHLPVVGLVRGLVRWTGCAGRVRFDMKVRLSRIIATLAAACSGSRAARSLCLRQRNSDDHQPLSSTPAPTMGGTESRGHRLRHGVS